MTTVVHKDILRPGKVQPSDWAEPYEITPEQVPYFRDRLTEMLAAGLNIPFSWDHQEVFEERPFTAAEWAERKAELQKLTIGSLRRADVLPDGSLDAELDAELSEEEKRRLKAVGYASPYIAADVVDGTGKLWPGYSIIGLAATNRPVQTGQQPFRLGLPTEADTRPLRLSLSLGAPPPAGKGTPKGDMPMKGSKTDMPMNGNGDGDGTGPAAQKPGEASLGRVLAKLKAKGITLPDDTTPKNFVDRLDVALTALGAEEGMEGEQGGTTVSSEPNARGQQQPVQAASPPLAMGLKDPEARLLADKILAGERATLKQRISALFGTLLGRPETDALLARADKEPLTLGLDGTVGRSPLAVEVEAYEKALAKLKGTPFGLRLGLGGKAPVTPDPPEGHHLNNPGGGTTPQQARQVIDDTFAAMGRR